MEDGASALATTGSVAVSAGVFGCAVSLESVPAVDGFGARSVTAGSDWDDRAGCGVLMARPTLASGDGVDSAPMASAVAVWGTGARAARGVALGSCWKRGLMAVAHASAPANPAALSRPTVCFDQKGRTGG